MIALINVVKSEDLNKVERAAQIIEICRLAMQQLKQQIQTAGFASKQDEIHFFKTIKPRFHSQLIFQLKVYHIEINRPTGSNAMLEDYLMKEFYKLRLFFEDHTPFYHYYRSAGTYLDEEYFTRKNGGIKESIQFLYIDADPSFSTTYDYQVARILANGMLSDYLNAELATLNNKKLAEATLVKSSLDWKDSKVALAELIYALHASGVFGNSKVDIKTITDYLSEAFNIRIGNIYKVFEEIRLRKKNRTVFLDFLRQNLIQRMDRDDEQAL